jgi:hypothetical protein
MLADRIFFELEIVRNDEVSVLIREGLEVLGGPERPGLFDVIPRLVSPRFRVWLSNDVGDGQLPSKDGGVSHRKRPRFETFFSRKARWRIHSALVEATPTTRTP